MEPLTPEAREQLKRAHPGLADADIDRYEDLNVRRFALDPAVAGDEMRRLDGELEALVRSKMPQFAAVVNATLANQRRYEERKKAPPRIETLPGESPEGPP
jgi:hypothetical protein